MNTQLDEFEQHRRLMFTIAYRMLGTVSDAEDMLQEVFLRWQRADLSTVTSPKSYLSATVTRLCIDHLKSARVRREQYVGPWLPEPLIAEPNCDPASVQELSESLSMAFLMMLEQLTPTERAAFLLHDVFGFDFGEVSAHVGKSAVNCRQLCSRARRKLQQPESRFEPDAATAERLASEFLVACQTGDLDGLVAMMTDDVTLLSDGGGKVVAALQPIHGPVNVARFLVGVTKKAPADMEARRVIVNGTPGVSVVQNGIVVRVLSMEFDGDKVRAICIVGNPDKLQHLQAET